MLGPPGSGKGTVSQMLAKEFGFPQYSAGELLRDEIKKETSVGIKIKEFVESGKLVPDQLVVEIMKLQVSESNNFIFDGFPRTEDQANSIEGLHIDMALYLEVPDEVVVERFAGRRMDQKTGKVYHVKYNPPPEGVEVITRKDDTPEVIKDRLKVYHAQTQPLIAYYKEKGILKTVDGAPPPDEVYEVVRGIVKEFQKK